MAEITLTKTIESLQPISDDIIKGALKKILSSKFGKFKFLKKAPNIFVCRVKTKLFNPIVSLKGDIQTQIQGSKAKVMITATTKTNSWFWFSLICIAFFTFGIGILVTIWMYHSQKNASIEAFKQAFEQLEFELGKI